MLTFLVGLLAGIVVNAYLFSRLSDAEGGELHSRA